MTIPIYKPFLPQESLKYAHEALDSTWISSQGKYITLVQEKLEELLKVKHVLLLNNGTSACHLVAKALSKNLNLNNKKIIVPDNVYAAAWNGFLFDKEYKLIPIKTDLKTWNFDLKELKFKIEKYPEASVLIVHNIGNIINVPELKKQFPNTTFVEDNCEGFLGKYNNLYSGTASLASSISFFGNKNITSGEGGAFITNNDELYNYCKVIHSQGQSATRFIHSELGYNYRITNIQAAILHGQLEILPQILEMKQEVFIRYRNALKNHKKVFIQSIENGTEHSNWMFGIRIKNNKNYEIAETYFRNNGVDIRPMFYPITSHTHLVNKSNISKSNCKNAEILNRECIILPSYPGLTVEEQNHILKVLNDYIKEIK